MALKMCCRVASQFLQMYLLLAFRFTSDCFNGNLFVFASLRCHLSHQNKHALNYNLDSLLASACSQKKKKMVNRWPTFRASCVYGLASNNDTASTCAIDCIRTAFMQLRVWFEVDGV